MTAHLLPTRSIRVDLDREYAPAVRAAQAAGYPVNTLIRACLREIAADPVGRLAALAPYLAAVEADTPMGRPRRER